MALSNDIVFKNNNNLDSFDDSDSDNDLDSDFGIVGNDDRGSIGNSGKDDVVRKKHSSNNKEKKLAAASLIAFKLKKSKKLKDLLKSHFSQFNKQTIDFYKKNGFLPSFNVHRKAVKSIVQGHYEDTAGDASSFLRDGFKPIPDDDKLQALIDTNITIGAEERSDFASDSIAQTTANSYKDAIKRTLTASALVGEEATNDHIANEMGKDFVNTLDGRLDLISQTETAVATDEGKIYEIDAIDDTDSEFDDGTTLSNYKVKKTWMAVLDDRTRPAHAEADGQIVNYDEPFIVDGEELMYPRDDSLGASDDNIFGCRCESVESLE